MENEEWEHYIKHGFVSDPDSDGPRLCWNEGRS